MCSLSEKISIASKDLINPTPYIPKQQGTKIFFSSKEFLKNEDVGMV
jgi:hypothetical protein